MTLFFVDESDNEVNQDLDDVTVEFHVARVNQLPHVAHDLDASVAVVRFDERASQLVAMWHAARQSGTPA